jgi:predicted esterase
MRATLSLPLLLALALPAAADPGADIARELASGRLGPVEAAHALTKAGVTPEAARELLAGALPLERGAVGEQRVSLTDPHGQKTDLILIVPDAPRADGRYGLLVVLHGLRGNAEQLVPFARRVAPPGFIVAAPEAQFIPAARDAEDAAILGDVLGAGAGAEPGRNDDTRNMLDQARRALFPHWWGYGEDGFPLLAVDAVRRGWSIDPDRVVLMGYSMGGFGTWGVGLRHPDRFAAIAPLAGGISRQEMIVTRDDRVRALLGNARMVPSFFVHGASDRTVPTRFSRTIDADLTALGAEHVYREVPGGGHILMPFLRGNELTTELGAWVAERVRDPHPRAVEHHAIKADHGTSYWVRIDAIEGETAMVKAEVTGRDRIVIHAERVTRVTLFLDPALVDVGAPITVEVDGRVMHQGVVASSLEAVTESFAARRDPSLVYAHALTLDLAAPAPESTPAPVDERRYF